MRGERFGRWTVIKRAKNYISPKGACASQWLCRCDCGNIKVVLGNTLRNGQSKSCGCLRRERASESNRKNLIGMQFGKLTATEECVKRSKGGAIRWVCSCVCGNKITVPSGALTSGGTKSCGCVRKEQIRKLGKSRKINLIGQRFGKLLVTKEYPQEAKGQKIRWVCLCDCGQSCIITTNELRNSDSKSCGCLSKDRMRGESNRGANNPNWKGGVTPESQAIRQSDKYNAFRISVLARDNYICRYCGDKTGGNLHAHHINSFKGFSEQRFITSNGITLCEKCHNGVKTPNLNAFHRLYGTHNCTASDFKEWFMMVDSVEKNDVC